MFSSFAFGVLLLLSHAVSRMSVQSLRLTQTKIVQLPDSSIAPSSWPVEGVATIELGGQTLIGYYMGCFSNVNDGNQLRWSRVLANNPFDVQSITNGSRLVMSAATLQYTSLGEYQCVDNATGMVAILNITDVNPAISPQVESVEALAGHQADLAVFVSTIDGPLPERNVTWYRPSGEAMRSSDPRVTFRTSGRRLILSGLTANDSGSYVCTAVHSVGLSVFRRSTAIELKVLEMLVVFITVETYYAQIGETVNISASINSTSRVSSIQWYWNETLLDPASDRRYSVDSDSSQSVLTILRFETKLVGRYGIVVFGASGRNSTDGVNVLLSGRSSMEPVRVHIVPDQVEAGIGATVELICTTRGSEPIELMWLLEDGTQTFPKGVSVADSRLFIQSTSPRHSNTYVCNASNSYGQDTAFAVINVLYPPTANITSKLTSNAHTLTSYGNTDTPSFTCSADGNPPPVISWQHPGGGPLPSGVVQQAVEGVGQRLSWTRPLNYTDPDCYECVAQNKEGRSTLTVNLQEFFYPVIDTIFPAPGVSSTAHSTLHYSVSLEFTGPALTCSGFGWPPLSIQWTRDSGPLPSGVSTAMTQDGERVRAKLVFNTPFTSSFVGVYKCEIRREKKEADEDRKDEKDNNMVFQLIELSLNSSANTQTQLLFFQLHVFSRGCESWTPVDGAQTLREFHELLIRVVLSECDCKVSRHSLSVNSLQCSYFISGGSVFRGYVNTSSSALSRTIFCTLLQWQKSGSFVSLNASLFAVDSQYSLQPSSYARVECGAKDEATVLSRQTNLNNTASVLSTFVLVLMSCIVAAAVAVLTYWIWRRRGKRILSALARRRTASKEKTDEKDALKQAENQK